MSALAIGDPIPNVKLLDADGAAIDVAAMKGAPLVVYFYPKADTPGCTTEAQAFTRLAPEFAHLDAQVLAVRSEERRVGKQWVRTCNSRGSPLLSNKYNK